MIRLQGLTALRSGVAGTGGPCAGERGGLGVPPCSFRARASGFRRLGRRCRSAVMVPSIPRSSSSCIVASWLTVQTCTASPTRGRPSASETSRCGCAAAQRHLNAVGALSAASARTRRPRRQGGRRAGLNRVRSLERAEAHTASAKPKALGEGSSRNEVVVAPLELADMLKRRVACSTSRGSPIRGSFARAGPGHN